MNEENLDIGDAKNAFTGWFFEHQKMIYAIVLCLVIFFVVTYFFYDPVEYVEITPSGYVPEIDPESNPLENAPDLNPVSNTNPYSGVKTNPFE